MHKNPEQAGHIRADINTDSFQRGAMKSHSLKWVSIKCHIAKFVADLFNKCLVVHSYTFIPLQMKPCTSQLIWIVTFQLPRGMSTFPCRHSLQTETRNAVSVRAVHACASSVYVWRRNGLCRFV